MANMAHVIDLVPAMASLLRFVLPPAASIQSDALILQVQ